jgi:hypothetical protein
MMDQRFVVQQRAQFGTIEAARLSGSQKDQNNIANIPIHLGFSEKPRE